MRTIPFPCPACGAASTSVFYEQFGIPMNSMLLLDSESVARSFPKGDLALGYCHDCGFITNSLYDPGSSEYSQRYESSQAFSGVFNSFAHGLAQRWIDRHDIRNKTVLEIGCDKGDFLALMCELGNNTGIGIDPAADPTRQIDSEAAGRMSFIADFYDEKYAHVRADVVICRHTLEHIPNVFEFVLGVRKALADQPNALVLFELPDSYRVLRDRAFWDVYYEHCSYFTMGSLARLFRKAGFDVLKLERDFDDQYLLIEARPSASIPATSDALAEEDDFADVLSAVEAYELEIAADLEGRRSALAKRTDAGQRVVVWGGGSKGVAYLTSLGLAHEVRHAVDINPYKQGKFMAGFAQAVVGPEALVSLAPDVVVVMNSIYVDEIKARLVELAVPAMVTTTDDR